ncbi:hypothetical protein Pryu01_01227 [Paraliobacillus ryukyuensis]|uniref:Uncharacterized protein n=1 Tax=Paraliobacillus ryukyuensis TaxID=200904 RepID=A0A366ECS0_9BACI|nr:hypothetical protein [Paraliobacillus ryukyuensis]RBO99539.1 hypothetical protein DES48_104215 [Paraliobacillus ryukyuensis]
MSKKMTIDEIKSQLDEKEIEYKSSMNRDELLDLLTSDTEDEPQQEETAAENEENEQPKEPKQYVVIHDFKDLKDRDIIYVKDDVYPKRVDSEISEERFQELMSDQNKIGKPLIKEQD